MEAIGLALLGYPLGILANISYDQLKAVSRSLKNELEPLKGVFLKALRKSLKLRKKRGDEYSKTVIASIEKQLKRDKDAVWRVLAVSDSEGQELFGGVRAGDFRSRLARRFVEEFDLADERNADLVVAILAEALEYYTSAFFIHMTEREGIILLLLKSLQLDAAVEILKGIQEELVTASEFDELRRILVSHVERSDPQAKGDLATYRKYLQAKFRYLELRGLSPRISGKNVKMPLDAVFVPLGLKHDDDLGAAASPGETSTDLVDALASEKCLVLLGDPGSGKSTVLSHYAYQLSKSKPAHPRLAKLVPIYLRAGEYAPRLDRDGLKLHDYIRKEADSQFAPLFQDALECNALVLLLDGLDEIKSTKLRNRVVLEILDVSARYPMCRFVVTSRLVGYKESALGGEFVHYRLSGFDPVQVNDFVQRWYQAIAKATPDKNYDSAEQRATDLMGSLRRNASVMRLAQNPLLTTIIAMIHYRGSTLPDKRVQLYDIATETFLEYWVKLRVDKTRLKAKNDVLEVLAPIAFRIHDEHPEGLIGFDELRTAFVESYRRAHEEADDAEAKLEFNGFIEFLGEEAGYFYEKGEDDRGEPLYGFMHQTFQEYLAGIEMVDRWEANELQLEDHTFEARWTEVIRLAAAQLKYVNPGRTGRVKATRFLNDILDTDDPFEEARRLLQLAILVLSDSVGIQDKLARRLVSELLDAAESEHLALRRSISRLMGDLLASDYGAGLVAQIESRLQDPSVQILDTLGRLKDKETRARVLALLDDSPDLRGTFFRGADPVVACAFEETLLEFFREEEPDAGSAWSWELALRFLRVDLSNLFRSALGKLSLGFELASTARLELASTTKWHDYLTSIAMGQHLSHEGVLLDTLGRAEGGRGVCHVMESPFDSRHATELWRALGPMNPLSRTSRGRRVTLLGSKQIRTASVPGTLSHWIMGWPSSTPGLVGVLVAERDWSLIAVAQVAAHQEAINAFNRALGALTTAEVEALELLIAGLGKLPPRSYFLGSRTPREWESVVVAALEDDPRRLSDFVLMNSEKELAGAWAKEPSPLLSPIARLKACTMSKQEPSPQLVAEALAFLRSCSPDHGRSAFGILYQALNPFQLT